MHRAGCVCACACSGQGVGESRNDSKQFSYPSRRVQRLQNGSGGLRCWRPLCPLSQAGRRRMPSLFSWGRLAGLWGNMPMSRLQELCAPSRALPDLQLLWGSPRGLGVAPQKAAWGRWWSCALPAPHVSVLNDGREVRCDRESCFSLPVVFLCLFFATEREGI